MARKSIEIQGARENNLRNINVSIPRDQLTVITGVSGSGKSSLAFDTLFAEGHRRFIESLSAWTRSRIPAVKKPDVNLISGLSPVVSIQQKKGIRNPRSTVASLTDIGSYLRLLYALAGTAHCPFCGQAIYIHTPAQIVERILSLPQGTQVEIRAIVPRVYGEDVAYVLNQIRNRGYRRARIHGQLVDLSEDLDLEGNPDLLVEAIVDQVVVQPDIFQTLTESVEAALVFGQKFLGIDILDPALKPIPGHPFHERFTCPEHHTLTGELLPWYFSANDPESACQTCLGLGTHKVAEPFLMVTNENKSLREGAIEKSFFNLDISTFKRVPNHKYMLIYSLAQHYGFSLDTPFKDLPERIKDLLFYGTRGEKFTFLQPPDHVIPARPHPHVGKQIPFEGLAAELNRMYQHVIQEKRPMNSVEEALFDRLMVERTCPDCHGVRLQRSRLWIEIQQKTIHDAFILSLKDLGAFLERVILPENRREAGASVLAELKKRIALMVEIGLDYLSLHRRSDTLSGGEIQRTILSTQIGSELMGMLYVLDEPSIGLHQRDTQRLIRVMRRLRDLGNTVIVVEHDHETMLAADYLIEIGPGPGVHGGQVVYQGPAKAIQRAPGSLTGQYLAGIKRIEVPARRRTIAGPCLRIVGAREHNLKNITVEIPLGVLVAITGVSGSGKSSLINEIVYKRLHQAFRDRRVIPGLHERFEGIEHLRDVRYIDQAPIGRSSRSNPATYVGIYDAIRKLFAGTPEAQTRGADERYFSFNNTRGGRCLTCQGEGTITTQLQYLPDVESTCPECKGARFNSETLEIRYRGKNIAEVLNMSIEEALEFFSGEHLIHHKLNTLNELGMGYIRLGQSSATLSGGEAQRIKLATELGKLKSLKGNLYILDEPTTGLHMSDIQTLLLCLQRIVDAGNTVLVIEHNLDVVKTADYVIDLGPEGGDQGGLVIAAGTPEEVARVAGSYTGQHLRRYLS
jgi:excinuclease ABC subunit A